MTKKELNKRRQEIINEFDKLQKYILNENEISTPKSYLLKLKLQLIEYSYNTLINEIEKIFESENKKYSFYSNIVLIELFLSFIMAFINPYIFLILVYLSTYGCRRLFYISEDRKREAKNFEEEQKTTRNNFTSCFEMINSKICKALPERVLEQTDMKSINLANQYLDLVSNHEPLPEISDDVKNVLVSMLQSELNTKETDLNKLIMIFSDQIQKQMDNSADLMLKRQTS